MKWIIEMKESMEYDGKNILADHRYRRKTPQTNWTLLRQLRKPISYISELWGSRLKSGTAPTEEKSVNCF